MKIAIHAADLDDSRIDGTRVYMFNVLKKLGEISPETEFLIYHKGNFNSSLVPPSLKNYEIRKIAKFPFWTHTSFALALWRDRPDILWMPATNLPILRNRSMRTVVTVHDLAYRYFPKHFPFSDRIKLKFFASLAVKFSDGIIAVSESTRDDILKFHKCADKNSIKVVYHGFDADLFQREIAADESIEILKKYDLDGKNYILYVGAIQPRKNLEVLIEAFEKIKPVFKDLKLVIAGERAWMWKGVISKIGKSDYKEDIIVTGKVDFRNLPVFYANSRISIMPSLYEGFGIPILEALASGVPMITARNSSLPEVGGDACLYFNAENSDELARRISDVLGDESLASSMIRKGEERIGKFSWEKCAKETLEFLKMQ